MSDYRKDESGFVGYEYNEITVDQSMESVYADGYQNFGWELEGSLRPHRWHKLCYPEIQKGPQTSQVGRNNPLATSVRFLCA